jgi:photosystem II stability/assembly factor-like uncharacterized protein
MNRFKNEKFSARLRLGKGLVASFVAVLAISALSIPALGQAVADWDKRFDFRADVIAATTLVDSDEILAVGKFGMMALITFDKENSTARMITGEINEDLISVAALNDKGAALVGGSEGNIYRYENGELSMIQNLGPDAVLDISVQRDVVDGWGNYGEIFSIWASGGRGILAVSTDAGRSFKNAAPARVTQPTLTLPNGREGMWFSGVGNIYEDTIKLRAKVNGRWAERGKDFVLNPEDGIMEVFTDLDASPTPTLSFEFQPGPPFQAGDFSLNRIMFQGDLITAVGEFGFILQTEDFGKTWVRQAGVLTDRDMGTPYWISGEADGDTIVLVGAGGMTAMSTDRGKTWDSLASPSDGGVFGVHLGAGGDKPLVMGAVGLLGQLNGDSWDLVDRTSLGLFSWLKTAITVDGNTLLALGGRGSCVYKTGDNWNSCSIAIVTDDNV